VEDLYTGKTSRIPQEHDLPCELYDLHNVGFSLIDRLTVIMEIYLLKQKVV
jgi:hypothetical protein